MVLPAHNYDALKAEFERKTGLNANEKILEYLTYLTGRGSLSTYEILSTRSDELEKRLISIEDAIRGLSEKLDSLDNK